MPLENQTQPKPKYPVTMLHILLVLLVALVSGSSVYLWQLRTINELKERAPYASLPNQQQQGNAFEIKYEKNEKFEVPYPIVWEDSIAEYKLTGAAIGEMEFKADQYLLLKRTGGNYKRGDKVYVLELTLNIKTKPALTQCIPMDIRLTNDQDDLFAPLSRQLYLPDSQGCVAWPNMTYSDMKIYFEANRGDQKFPILTGEASSAKFSVVFSDSKVAIKDISKIYDFATTEYLDPQDSIDLSACRNEALTSDNRTTLRVAEYRDESCVLNYDQISANVYKAYECIMPKSGKVSLDSLMVTKSCELEDQYKY